MEVRTLKVSKVQTNNGQIEGLPKNPRSIRDEKYKTLKKSIEDFPEMLSLREIVVYPHNDKFVCVGGNMRFRACKDLGHKEIVAKVLPSDFPPEKLAEFTIKDNSSFGDNDWDLLSSDWCEFEDNFLEWGLEVPSIEAVEPLEAVEDEFDTTPLVEAITVLGDLYEIGEHRLLCGDSTSITDVERLMDGKKADMVFTDPPYSIVTEGGSTNLGNSFKNTAERIKDIVDFTPTEWLQTLPLYFKQGMNAFIFCNKDLVPNYLNFAVESGFHFNILVWCKKQVVPFTGGHHYSDIEYIIYLSKNPIFNNGLEAVEYRKYFVLDNEKHADHPTIKPIPIIANQVQIGSNKKGVVVDSFLGSGSTMVADHQLNRKCYGMELEPKYCDVIVKRMKALDADLVVKRNGEVCEDFD